MSENQKIETTFQEKQTKKKNTNKELGPYKCNAMCMCIQWT